MTHRETDVDEPSGVGPAPPELVDRWVEHVATMRADVLDSFERRIFTAWFPESLTRLEQAIRARRVALRGEERRQVGGVEPVIEDGRE